MFFIILKSNYICYIPARAGSKRIKNKNIKLLGSKPLIQHTIDFALQIFESKDIYVSTDSNKASEIASNSGVNIHKRPYEYARDDSSMLETTLNFLESENIENDKTLVLLQPTSPFRNKDFFLRLLNLFENSDNATSAISVLRCTFFHPSKIGQIGKQNLFNRIKNIPREKNIDNDKKIPFYVISGTYYVVKVSELRKTNSFTGINPVALPEDPSRFCNIDNQFDFELAKYLIDKQD